MRHDFHPEALAEYEEAARYYADRDPRVVEQFVAAVEDVQRAVVAATNRI